MTIYVDQPRWRLGRMKMCHMTADTEKELHEMAECLGLKREWFQSHTILLHYDICKAKRAKAIRLGAVIQSTKDCIKRQRKMNEERKVYLRRVPCPGEEEHRNDHEFYAPGFNKDFELIPGRELVLDAHDDLIVTKQWLTSHFGERVIVEV